MGLLPISAVMLSDPNYRFAILYKTIDRVVCDVLCQEFGQVHIRFKVVIETGKINVSFFYLDKYYLTYLRVNEKWIKEQLIEAIVAQKLTNKHNYKIYFKYVS
jgi:hypothetical protein